MTDKQRVVYIFPTGVTATFIDGSQVPDLQEPWLVLLFKHFEAQGQNPKDFEWHLNGSRVFPFRTTFGWNWSSSPQDDITEEMTR